MSQIKTIYNNFLYLSPDDSKNSYTEYLNNTSDTKKDENKKDIIGSTNLEEIKKKRNLFTKSYYAHDFLTPYIKCFIVSKDYINENNEVRKKNVTQQFFDIPYNLIKNMELEYIGGFGVDGNLSLKIEDPTGTIGSFLVAAFYSLSLTGDNNSVPYINIEFGWSEKGLKKISKRNMNRIFTKNSYSAFTILDIKIEFSDKGKQEITITAKQAVTGSPGFSSSGESDISPFSTLGNSPVFNMRLLQYYHYFKKKENDKTLGLGNKFSIYDSASNKEKQNIEKIVKNFTKEVKTNNEAKNKKTEIDNNIIEILSKENTFFNFETKINDPKFTPMKEKFDNSIKKSYFNPYLVFCYILNQYITTIKQYYSEKEKKKIDVLVLPLYKEKDDIDDKGLLIDKYEDIEDFCFKDVEIGTSGKDSKHKSINDLTHTFEIKKNESWESVLERLANLVKIKGEKNSKEKKNLYISIQKYSGSEENIKKNNINTASVFNKNKEMLIKKFENLKKMFEEEKNKNSSLIDGFIEQIKEQVGDFIYITITKGSPFLTDENEKIIAQSYTVYPKIEPKNRISDQNFNSGSKPNSLLEESFPDVLYFKSEIPFKELFVNFLKSGHKNIFNNGFFSFKRDNFFIEYENNADANVNQDLIKGVISQLKGFTEGIKEKPKKVQEITVKKVSLLEKNNSTSNIAFKLSFNKKEDNTSKKTKNDSADKTKVNSSNEMSVSPLDEVFIYHHELPVDKNVLKNDDPKHVKIILKLIEDLEKYYKLIYNGYHYSELLNIIKKSNNIFIGDNNTSEYYNYINSSDEYNKMLMSQAAAFNAELKILGEPAFAFDFSKIIHVFVKVYNLNGSLNRLLTGVYSIEKVKHEISENGSFTTTLSLKIDSAYVS